MKTPQFASAGAASAGILLALASTAALGHTGDHEAMQLPAKLLHYLGHVAMPIASLAVATVGISLLRQRPRRNRLRIRKR